MSNPAEAAGEACHGCQQRLRKGAKYCPACGYSFLTDSAPAPRPEASPLASSASSHWNALKQVCLLFGLLLCSSLALGLLSNWTSSPWLDVIVSVADALIVAIFAMRCYREILPLLRLPEMAVRQALVVAGFAAIFLVVMDTYFKLIEQAGVPFFSATASYISHAWPVWSMVLMISVMPAVVEEIAFRGVIQSYLERLFSSRDAWLIQAALFSVLHLMPIMFPSHFIMGLCFGYLRLVTRSLYPAMLLHASWNALVLCEELYWP